MKVSMDGNNKTIIIDTEDTACCDLFTFTIDYQNQVLYLVYQDHFNHSLRVNSSNVHGTNRQLVAQLNRYSSRIISVTVFQDMLFLTFTFGTGSIYKLRIDDDIFQIDRSRVLGCTGVYYNDLKVFSEEQQPLGNGQA